MWSAPKVAPHLQTTPISDDSQQTFSGSDEFPPLALTSEELNHPGDEQITPQPDEEITPQPDEEVTPQQPTESASAQQDSDTQPTTSEAVNELFPSTDQEADEEQPFTLDGTMESRLEQLLEAAADREQTRVTRSHGINLQWSSEMNPDNVLQPEEEI